MSALPASASIHAMGLIAADGSLFVQLGLFLLLVFIVNRLLFRPTLETLTLRDQRTAGARAEADTLKADAEATIDAYETALSAAKKDALDALKALRDEGAERRDEVVGAAQARTEKLITENRAELEKATAEARTTINPAGDQLGRDIVDRLMGGGAGSAAAFLLLTFATTSAYAGGGGDASDPYGWLVGAGYLAVNLAILLFILVKLGKPGLTSHLETRKADITRELEEASQLRAEAQAMVDDYRARMANLDSERESMMASFRKDGEAEKARLLAEGEAAAERLEVDARRSIDQEVRRARMLLQDELLERALSQANEVLTARLGEAQHRGLVDEFVEQLTDAQGAP